jgi:hypothetical protein
MKFLKGYMQKRIMRNLLNRMRVYITISVGLGQPWQKKEEKKCYDFLP